MIDSLDNLLSYVSLHPRFEQAFDFIRQLDFSKLKKGRIVVDDDIYINVDEIPLRPLKGARYETHDAYIDIQIPLTTNEIVGYADRNALGAPAEVHKDMDIAFYDAPLSSSVELKVGSFAIFFPQDGHMPIIGEGMTKKIVVKVRVEPSCYNE